MSTMSLATVGLGGEVHAADVYFASDEQMNLYYFSAPSSQHSRDIQWDPQAAVTIHAHHTSWEQILGVQMRGICYQVTAPPAWEQAWAVYLEKFPFVQQLSDIIKVNQLYGFTPVWIRLVDNSRGFGYKQEWQAKENETASTTGGQWDLVGSRTQNPEIGDG
jgi:uncharacterized protein YhbP (UPF0306 family)